MSGKGRSGEENDDFNATYTIDSDENDENGDEEAVELPQSTDLPNELKIKLADFHTQLSQVHSLVDEEIASLSSSSSSQQTCLERAKKELTSSYVMTSLMWMLVCVEGGNPRQHAVKGEVERVREMMRKVKELEVIEKGKERRVDVPAASRFIRNALWQPGKKRKSGKVDADSSGPKKPSKES